VLAATDPASPFGAAVPWPERSGASTVSATGSDGGADAGADRRTTSQGSAGADSPGAGHRPGRKAGSLVATVDGKLVLYLERGGRTALTYSEDPDTASAVAAALAARVRGGHLAALTVARIDGVSALSSPHPLAAALQQAGFHTAPQGLRLRR